ncbi:MAG TPA: adenosine deaminase [Spirochaetia bacterium]|nr:adenosine deaminase [Spirochaetia bacterium]
MGGLQQYIASLPKTEIHLHVEACVGPSSYHELMEKYDIPHDDKTNSLTDFSKIGSLKSMLESFWFVQSFFREPSDFQLVVEDVVKYALRNKIYYIEAFAAPSMVLNRGMISFDDMFATMVKGFDEAEKEHGVDVRLIVDVSRSFGPENAMKNLDLTIAFLKNHPTSRMLGIGLGGQEVGHPCREYEEVFAKAREAGLHVVAHAGEEVGPESIWEAIDILKAERIGHGTSASQDPALIERLAKDQIPLEICPTSNVITKKFVPDYSKHPIRKFFDNGVICTVNTDDPVLFSVELNEEYERVATQVGFSRDEIMTLVKHNLMSTFLSDSEKKVHWDRVQRAVGRI